MEQSWHLQHDVASARQPSGNGLTRRRSLQWLGIITAGLAAPIITGCESLAISAAKIAGDWPDLKLEPITGDGYGTDPNLVSPPDTPWPLTMTAAQRQLVAVLADILVPRDGEQPAASEVGVTELIDEWISAPYPSFQSDRVEILSGLAWLDQESVRRFGKTFVQASSRQQLAIVDDIAYQQAESELRFAYIARVFDGIRTLVVIAYFSSAEGTRELGYQGNVAIAGDYPGPTREAMAHLEDVLQELGLGEYAYPEQG